MSGFAPSVQSQFVEASAGTGKTRELVMEIAAAIRAGVPVERIVAVTFTHAAAGEMKLRLREELDRGAALEADEAGKSRMAAALQTLDRAFIGTIHAFCAQLLRQRPVEACVDPSFQELAQPEALRVFHTVFRQWMERKLASPSEALTRVLSRRAWRDDGGGEPLDALRHAAWCLAEWRDHPASWERRPCDWRAGVEALIERARPLVAKRNQCPRPTDEIYTSLQPLADLVTRYDRARRIGTDVLAIIEGELLRVPRPKTWSRNGNPMYAPGLTRDAIVLAWDEFMGEVDRYSRPANAELAAALRDELWEVVELYGEAKRRAGQLDFLDLLIYARDLLRNSSARAYFQQRYERIFIDEFQDTDPLQAEILLLIASGDAGTEDWRSVVPAPGKLFVVGDPKQSIYRFRRADARLYRSIHARLLERGVAGRRLSKSHRSVAPIQEFVNAAFSHSIPEYLPLQDGPPAPASQPSILALPIPRPFGKRNISKAAIDSSSPSAVAAFIEWLVRESKWTVRDPATGDRVPVQPEHICVLFRRFTNWGVDLTQEYVRCLEARGIEHLLVGSKSFHRREEVGTLRTALRAIEWPDDELSVYAVLRGSFFAIPDGTLLKFRHLYKRCSPFLDLPEDLDPEFEPVRDALALLAKLHRARNARPVSSTIGELLKHTRAHAAFAFRKGGERVLANVYRFADLARAFEAPGSTSFRAFVDYLEEEALSGETTEAPVLEQQGAGVKLMTVHKAKGLEFPVVILADLTAKLTGAEMGSRYVDSEAGLCAQRLLGCHPWELIEHAAEEARDEAEEALRVAYVAATRARDLLVVSAIGEKRMEESWLSPLYEALYPPRERWRRPGTAPGCPPFGRSTVLNRPDDQPEDTSICPGLHQPSTGAHEVVWFDPALLGEVDTRDHGFDRQELLQGGEAELAVGLQAYEAWRDAHIAVLASGAQPAMRVRRITELGEIAEAASIPVETLRIVNDRVRPGGRGFGRLVHAILQAAPEEAAVGATARAQGRRLHCSLEEIEAAAEAARTALAHPLIRPARALKICRELPVMVELDGGILAEGVIDLAWWDGSGWTVIDYKTDSGQRNRYRHQLQVYGLALARATNQPVRCLLIEV